MLRSAVLPITILLLASGLSQPSAGTSRHLDVPTYGDGKGEISVEEKDDLESEKISKAAFDEIRFRNGLVLRPDPGLEPGLVIPFEGVHLIQFSGNVRLEWLHELFRLGVKIHDHVQGHTLIAGVPRSATEGIKELLRREAIRYIGPYPAGAKIDASLDLKSGSNERVSVLLVDGASPSTADRLASLMTMEGSHPAGNRIFRGNIPGNRIQGMPALEDVLWIERYVEGRTQNLEAAMSAAVDNGGNWAPGYESYGPMWVDATAPGNASSLGSETHPVGVCTDDGLVRVNWSPAVDDNCGLLGYSVAWSTGFPASPDEIMDLGPETQHEEALPPHNSNRYFNIRSVDAAGNWAPGFSSYGPFQIDEIPAEVGNLNVEVSGPDLHFWWSPEPSADSYAIYRDLRPWFPGQVQVGSDVTPTELWAFNEATGSDPVVYYLVAGKNVCGVAGP